MPLPVPDHPAAPVQPGSPRRLLKPALLLLGLLAAGLLLRHLPGHPHGLLPGVATLRDGASGRALFLLAGSLICALGLPRQAVCFAGGIAYGVWQGTLLSTAATVAGCLLGFGWARFAGRGWARRRLQGRSGGWLGRLDRRVSARPFATVLLFRLLPVGSSLALNLAAGVLGIATLPFALATLLGCLPQTMVFTLLGAGTRIGHGVQVLLAIALFAASGAVGLMLMRRTDPA